MKFSASAYSFGKTKRLEMDKTDKKFTPGPGMYSSHLNNKEKAPSWK
jgi:hypothetical protein